MKYRIRDFLEDIVSVTMLFAMIPLFPYAVAIVKTLL